MNPGQMVYLETECISGEQNRVECRQWQRKVKTKFHKGLSKNRTAFFTKDRMNKFNCEYAYFIKWCQQHWILLLLPLSFSSKHHNTQTRKFTIKQQIAMTSWKLDFSTVLYIQTMSLPLRSQLSVLYWSKILQDSYLFGLLQDRWNNLQDWRVLSMTTVVYQSLD